jgi:DNA-binding NarL/FixJ family response regulator
VTGGRKGIESLEQSTTVLADSGARLEHAKSLLELGAALRRAGHRTAAREALSGALDEAEICGAPPITEAAGAELRTAGFRPRRHRLTGVNALTPSERRIVEAAAGGATNREIAQSLFVTTKTVEVHLSSAFRKLGVSRRSELARQLKAAPPE